jgi:hypothetical protein
VQYIDTMIWPVHLPEVNASVRSQAKDSRKAMVEQNEFDEELSKQEGRLSL